MSGFSSVAPNLPMEPRNDMRVNIKKNMTVNARATAMNAGVVAVGAERRSGAFPGRTDKSYVGLIVGEVQFTGASLFGLEHEPSAPRKTVGPSTPCVAPGCVRVSEGDTVSKETRVCNITVGDR